MDIQKMNESNLQRAKYVEDKISFLKNLMLVLDIDAIVISYFLIMMLFKIVM